MILATLEMEHGDKRKAAVVLGISLKTLYNRLGIYRAGADDRRGVSGTSLALSGSRVEHRGRTMSATSSARMTAKHSDSKEPVCNLSSSRSSAEVSAKRA